MSASGHSDAGGRAAICGFFSSPSPHPPISLIPRPNSSSVPFWAVCPLLAGVLFAFFLTGSVLAQTASDPSPDTDLTRIDELRRQGQFRAALTRLDSLAEHRPPSTGLYWRRALLLTDLGKRTTDEDEAISLYRRAQAVADSARDTDETSPWAHLVSALAAGRLTLHVGRGERVRQSRAVKEHTDRAIALDSTLAPAYHLRGRWHREVADLNFIQRTLVKAIYGGLPEASFDRSIQDFKRAIDLESKPYNHLELAKTYLELDREGDARAHLQRALELSGSPFDDVHKSEARSLLKETE